MTVRNRIVDYRKVRAGDLLPDPRNWRKHPKAQRDALRTIWDRVGNADVLITRETPDGLMLVDGHLRADESDPNAEISVIVTDLDDDEAGDVLATLDPLAAMAEIDAEALQKLVDGMADRADEALASLIHDMHEIDLGVVPDFEPASIDEQSLLDRNRVMTCPECGHEWRPS